MLDARVELDDTIAAGAEQTPPAVQPQSVRAGELDKAMIREAARAKIFGRRPEAQTLGRYTLIQKLGAGGGGQVYAAYDPKLERRIALKLVHHVRDESDARLLREARAMARLSHPNIVQVYDVGTVAHGGRPVVYIAMELVDGHTLRAWLAERLRTTRQILALFCEIGRGLAAAHDVGLVHRDFKPDNVIVAREGRPRILDFGLVRRDRVPDLDVLATRPDRADDAGVSDEPATRSGAVMGTPAYMAPEQFDGADVDARSDQFAFCVALFEALHGARPFAGATISELAANVRAGARDRPPSARRLPARVRKAIDRGLALRPADRFASMQALLRELDAAGRRRTLVIGVSTAAALGLAGAYAASDDATPCADPHRELSGVWDDEQRQALRAAIDAAGSRFAERTAEVTLATLDDYASRWIASQREACEATLVHRRQSARMMDLRTACLRRLRGDLAAVVHVVQAGEPEAIERAVELAMSLPPPQTCDDTEALAAAIDPPDAALAPEVEGLRARLAEVRARAKIGKAAEVFASAQDVLAEAQGLGYRPLVAEARAFVAATAATVGELELAEREAIAAFQDALAAGHDEIVAFAATQMVHVLAQLRGRPADAEPWLGHASAATERIHDDGMARVRLLQREGALRFRQRRFDEAAARMRASCEMAETIIPDPTPDTLECWLNLGVLEASRGHHDEADALAHRVLHDRIALLGPEHPSVAHAYNLLGSIANGRGDGTASIRHYREAARIFEAGYGPEHPNFGAALYNVGNRLREAGDNASAREHYERTVAIYERVHGRDSPIVAGVVNNIALTHQNEGALDRALTQYERVIAILQPAQGPEREGLGIAHNNVGNILLDLERPDDAIPHYEMAVKVLEEELGAEHGSVASPLSGMGDAFIAKTEPALAIAPLARAVAIRAALDHPETSQTRYVLARALWMANRRAEAREHLRIIAATSDPDATLATQWLTADAMP